MPKVPAVCLRCGIIFPSGIVVSGTNDSFIGCFSRCPRCGDAAPIPSGVYSALTDSVLAFTRQHLSAEAIERLRDIFRSAQPEEKETEEVAREIRKEVPELAKLADALPKDRNQLYAFAAVLVALLGFVVQTCQQESPPPPDAGTIDAQQTADVIINNYNYYEAPPSD